MVTVINKDNSKWRVIYNENIVLLEKSKKLSFDVFDENSNFKVQLNFIFSDEGEKLKSNVSISEDGHILDITLNQWETDQAITHIENNEPLKLKMHDDRKIWIKFRTQTNEKNKLEKFSFNNLDRGKINMETETTSATNSRKRVIIDNPNSQSGSSDKSSIDKILGDHTESIIVALLFIITLIVFLIYICVFNNKLSEIITTGMLSLLSGLSGFFVATLHKKNKN